MDFDEDFSFLNPTKETKSADHIPYSNKQNESLYNPEKFFQFIGFDGSQSHYNQEKIKEIQELNYKNQNQNLSDMYYNNKLFPGLSGLVILEDPKLENDDMNFLNIKNPYDGCNFNGDLHLEKIFEEEIQYPNHQFEENEIIRERKNSIPKQKKNISGGGGTKWLPRFFDTLEMSIHDFVENADLHGYEEFTKTDILHNVSNVLFLEEEHEKSFRFSELFENNYLRLLKKLQLYHQHNKLDLKLLLTTVSSFGINLISDLIKFIKTCDGNFCFNIMKNEKNNERNKDNNNINNVQSRNIINLQPQNIMKTENSIIDTMSNSNLGQIPEKKNRKTWKKVETDALNNLLNTYYPGSVPSEVLEDMAKRFDRSILSLHAKIQKMKKTLVKSSEIRFAKEEEKMSNFFNIDQRSNKSAASIKGQNKYEIPIEKMIKITLSHFPNQTSTKDKIISKMSELFFLNSNDEMWKVSTSQLLASSKLFQKIKGIYSLNIENVSNEVKRIIESQNFDHLVKNESMKVRLIYVMSKLHDRKGEINIITNDYIKIFLPNKILDEDEKNKIKISIQKIIGQYGEFDKSNSKTLYTNAKENG